jgi:AcrR family transcriptional regulator
LQNETVLNARGGSIAAQRMRAEETRERLIGTARVLFIERGYHDTSTNDVVTRAAVTRGALYHHFTGKADLFDAVFRQVLGEVNDSAQIAAKRLAGNIWDQIVGAFSVYLRLIASSADFQRIVLIDGPVVLGWERWRTLQSERVAFDIAQTLRILMANGTIAKTPAEPLAFLMQAALNDAALSIAHVADPEAAITPAGEAFTFLLKSLRIRGVT